MSNKEVWNSFLENIKNEISNVSFDTWFNEEDTKFYSFKNNVMTIIVNQEFIRKHIVENYLDIMSEAISKVTNTNRNCAKFVVYLFGKFNVGNQQDNSIAVMPINKTIGYSSYILQYVIILKLII